MMNSMKTMAMGSAALLMAGCSLTQGWFDVGEPRRVEEITRGMACGGDSAEAWVRGYASVEALRRSTAVSAANLQGLDGLPPGAYTLIGMGQRSSGGHGLAVSREATEHEGVLRLQATFVAPAPGRMTIQMITSPCVLVRVPASTWRAVEVVDQDGVVRARAAVEG